MACNFISAGRALACKDSVGGSKQLSSTKRWTDKIVCQNSTDDTTGAIEVLY